MQTFAIVAPVPVSIGKVLVIVARFAPTFALPPNVRAAILALTVLNAVLTTPIPLSATTPWPVTFDSLYSGCLGGALRDVRGPRLQPSSRENLRLHVPGRSDPAAAKRIDPTRNRTGVITGSDRGASPGIGQGVHLHQVWTAAPEAPSARTAFLTARVSR